MTALAFESEINGNTIVIPEEYRGKISSTVLVTLIERRPRLHSEQDERKKAMRFSPPHIDTRGWKFDREEANAR